MDKKIVLVGLDSYANIGDTILIDSCKFLVEKALKDNEIYDSVKIDVLDLMKTTESLKKDRDISAVNGVVSGFLTLVAERIVRSNVRLNCCVYKIKNRVKYGKYFARSLKDAKAVIFVGGAYLKFSEEEFQYSIRHVLRTADKHHIPVMMNAVGIEGYSEKDYRCQLMKEAINLDCVKIITTRDDDVFLRENFITNKSIKTAEVADAALWLEDVYKISPSYSDDLIDVGINIAYSTLFEYNVSVNSAAGLQAHPSRETMSRGLIDSHRVYGRI